MEYRKIVRSGNTSFVVSIPRDWVMSNRISKGDLVSIEKSKENTLIIYPGERKTEPKVKEIKINVDEISKETLKRIIVSHYINGYSSLEFNGNITPEKAMIIKKTTEGLIAFEIMEQTPSHIFIKDYLDIKDASLLSVVKKMDVTIRAMLQECKQVLSLINSGNKKEAKVIADDIESMDTGMNRLSFLASKIIREGLENASVAQALSITPLQLLVFEIMSNTLENLADNIKNLASLSVFEVPRDELKFVSKQYNLSIANYEEVMSAYFSEDKDKSNAASDMKHKLREENEQYLRKPRSTAIVRMIERLQSFESFIGIVSRTTIDVI